MRDKLRIIQSGFLLILLLCLLTVESVEAKVETAESAPVPVEVGIRLHQIVEINQKKKNFTAVISVKGKWKDPKLAYAAEENEDVMVMTVESFRELVAKKGTFFPRAIIYNQQGKYFTKNTLITITPRGEVGFLDHATVVLQASNFDFRRFPFDTQLFEIHLDSMLPKEQFVFKELQGYSKIGDSLGEEEWVITGFSTRVSSSTDTTGVPGSRFTLSFQGTRHFIYYMTKIFIPMTLIIVVSWFTFFLKDYSKRIDLAGANLLLFIAFNFTISNELPKLGYVTFLDALLVATFIITSVVILINVQLKRLQNLGRDQIAETIDRYALWSYPFAYLVVAAVTVLIVFMLD